jgi:hypothetical protein
VFCMLLIQNTQGINSVMKWLCLVCMCSISSLNLQGGNAEMFIFWAYSKFSFDSYQSSINFIFT